ncbi:transposase, partial [Rhodovibrio sodomensis]
MWTKITRPKYDRRGLRYASDMTDPEWAFVELQLPPRKRLGCPPKTDRREVVNALLYMATTGCQWRMLPKDFPPRSTVQDYFYSWARSGVLDQINHVLVMAAR